MRAKMAWWSLGLIAGVAAWYAFRPERLWINQIVNESAPALVSTAAAVTEAKGNFHSVAHETHGQATILLLPTGARVLRFTDFATSNGPDLRVYLVAAADAIDSATVSQSKFIELAPLKGNIGDQNYELPSDLNLSEYGAVTVWCKRFGVNFATAPLHRETAQR